MFTVAGRGKGLGCSFGGVFAKDRKRRVYLEAACCIQRGRKEAEIEKNAKINLKGEDYSPSFSQQKD